MSETLAWAQALAPLAATGTGVWALVRCAGPVLRWLDRTLDAADGVG